jgi:chromosome segregation ATPase
MSEIKSLVTESLNLFLTSEDHIRLNNIANQIRDINDKYAEGTQTTAKALIKANILSGQLLNNLDVTSVTQQIDKENKDLERLTINNTNVEIEIKEIQRKKQETEIENQTLNERVELLEEQFRKLGGDKESKRKQEMKKAKAAVPVLRRCVGLWTNMTGITWDVKAPENELSGYVADKGNSKQSNNNNNNPSRVVEFRFNTQDMDEFEIANRIWNQMIG